MAFRANRIMATRYSRDPRLHQPALLPHEANRQRVLEGGAEAGARSCRDSCRQARLLEAASRRPPSTSSTSTCPGCRTEEPESVGSFAERFTGRSWTPAGSGITTATNAFSTAWTSWPTSTASATATTARSRRDRPAGARPLARRADPSCRRMTCGCSSVLGMENYGPRNDRLVRRHPPRLSSPSARQLRPDPKDPHRRRRHGRLVLSLWLLFIDRSLIMRPFEHTDDGGRRRRYRSTTSISAFYASTAGWSWTSTNSAGRASIRMVLAAVRMFLRYLAVEGHCRAGLEQALAAPPNWSRQSLPRGLAPQQIQNILSLCPPTSRGIRDRAILLLLIRLGLRAGDVAGLRLSDLCFETATIRVSGKGGREVRLPLPQDVGDALLTYLATGRPHVSSEHVFLRSMAPFGPFGGRQAGHAVTHVARTALKRAGVQPPSCGAHVFRHTAACQMLRQDGGLEDIAEVLRHR
jgi:integrase